MVDGPEGRHAAVVQRRGPGEAIDLVDGRGVRLRGIICSVAGSSVTVRVAQVVREPAPAVEVVLVQALAKGDRDERAVESATELGADRIVPWQADRSVVQWRGDRGVKGRAKWAGVVRAATKQSRRAWEPAVDALVTTAALTDLIVEVVAAGGTAMVLHESAVIGLPEAELPSVPVAAVAGASLPMTVLVVVGPEGGISQPEIDAFHAAGAIAVRLGPHILRTSTAGPAAIAVLSARLGRWSGQ